jgi:hypothetical protein
MSLRTLVLLGASEPPRNTGSGSHRRPKVQSWSPLRKMTTSTPPLVRFREARDFPQPHSVMVKPWMAI